MQIKHPLAPLIRGGMRLDFIRMRMTMKMKYNGEEAKLEEIFETYTFSD